MKLARQAKSLLAAVLSSSLPLVALFAAALALVSQTAAAQEARASSGLKRLAVTVVVNGKSLLGTFPVGESISEDTYAAEFTPPGRIRGWKPPEGEPPLTSLRLRLAREGDAVRIKVFAVSDDTWPPEAPGPKYGARERLVGTYLALEGETVNVVEVKSFGLEPFKLSISEAKPEPELPFIPAPARVVSRLKSIEVVSFLTEGEQLERGRLVLRNVSEKNVIAIEMETGGFHRREYSPGPRPLIESSATYEIVVGVGRGGRETPGGFAPAPQPDAFFVNTVVFADGSYEGDVRDAAKLFATREGRSTQLARVLALLQSAFDEGALDSPDVLARLKTQIGNLRIDVEPSVLNEMLSKFPMLRAGDGGRRIVADAAVEGLRTGRSVALGAIEAVERAQTQKADGVELRRQLEDVRAAVEKRAGIRRD